MGRKLTHEQASKVMLRAHLRPLEKYQSARIPWRSECLVCGSVGSPTYGNVRQRGTGCLECRKRKIGDANRGDSADAVAVMRAAGLHPLEPYRNVDHAWRCRCEICGEEVLPTLGSVKGRGSGCGFCAGNRITDEMAVATMLEADITPLEPYPGKAIVPWQCRCENCDHVITPSYNSVQQGKGCAYCAGVWVEPAEAFETMRAAGLEPEGPYMGGHMPWPSVCIRSGHLVAPTYSSVASGRGCNTCGYERSGAAHKNDSQEAERIMIEAGLKPLVPYLGARERWLCECVACGQEVYPRYDGVSRGGGGCIFCVSGGYDPTQAGAVYLMRHLALDALKIGIRNLSSNRIVDHERYNWSLVEEWQFDDGTIPGDVEAAVLDWWRNELEIPVACTPDQMPQAGYTETASMSDVSIEATAAFVSLQLDR